MTAAENAVPCYIEVTNIPDHMLRDLRELLADSWGQAETYDLREALANPVDREEVEDDYLMDYCAECGTRLPEEPRKRRKTCSAKCRQRLSRRNRAEPARA